jgi:hypothetical protein
MERNPVNHRRYTSSAKFNRIVFRTVYSLFAFALALIGAFASGCGDSLGGSGATGPVLSGSTSVTLLATSTANPKISSFNVDLTGITLTSQSGKAVTLLSTPLYQEFIHSNGLAEPLATANVPQDVYTSATVTAGNSLFACFAVDSTSGKMWVNEYSTSPWMTPASVTVRLPQPITVTGTSMGIALDLLVAQSVSYPSTCNYYGAGAASFSITPTFAITSVTIAAQPTNSSNGKLTSLQGQVSTVDPSQSLIVVNGPFLGPTWSVSIDKNTIFQGIGGISQLAPDMPVDMDVAIQADGSMLATRISVSDTDTTDLTGFTGPVTLVWDSQPYLITYNWGQDGYLSQYGDYDELSADFSSADFKISGAMANLHSLPFAASFTAGSIVPGQAVSVTAHVSSYPGGYPPVETVTLIPQTINGTVSAISNDNGFTTYTVTLAPYDLFPVAAVELFHDSPLVNPSVVVVYVDSNTQTLNTKPVTTGSVMRFYGLVFNDNGTLRMDCAQINDGVAE